MTGPLDAIRIVLNEPQDLVNIAGVARVMMNFGLSDLRVVRPAEYDAYRITGIAHRSEPVVDRARIVDSLGEALDGTVYVVGTTARPRTAGRNYGRPRPLAGRILERSAGGPVAVVFGREDRGLGNEDLDLCHDLVVIPTTPKYSSLNLAQACLVVAYELFLEAGTAAPLARGRRATEPATFEDLEETYGALRGGLERLDFFKARDAEAVLRTLRTIVSRAYLDRREARLVAAIGYEIGHVLDRAEQSPSRAAPGDPPEPG